MKRIIWTGVISFVLAFMAAFCFVYRTEIVDLFMVKSGPNYIITLPDKQIVQVVSEETAPEEIKDIPKFADLYPLSNLKPLKSRYASKSPAYEGFYKIAIMVKNFGLNNSDFSTVIVGLPSEVSFSLSPYASNIPEKVEQIRNKGHEVYLDIIPASRDILKQDTGPLSLNIFSDALEFVPQGLAWGGVVFTKGEIDIENSPVIGNILLSLKKSKMLMIDATEDRDMSGLIIKGLKNQKADIIIDENFERTFVGQQILKAESIAIKNGEALLVVDPKPSTLVALRGWIDSLKDKSLVLVPVSNLAVINE